MPDNRTPLYGQISALLGPTQAIDDEYTMAANALAAEQVKLPPMRQRLRDLQVKCVYGGGGTWADMAEYAQLGPQVEELQAKVDQMFQGNIALNGRWNELCEQLIATTAKLRR